MMIAVLFVANFKKVFKYKISFFTELISAFLQLVLFYFFWKNIYKSPESEIDAILLSRIVYLVIGSNYVWELSAKITSGNIVQELSKPYGFFRYNLLNTISCKVVNVFSSGLIVFGSFILIRKPDISIFNLIVFLISLLLGIIVCFCLDYLVSIFSVFTNSTWGISAFREGLIQIFSGALFPVAMLNSVAPFLLFFPFRYIVDIPVRILLNTRSDLYLLGVQIVYAMLMIILANWLETKLLKSIQIQGG